MINTVEFLTSFLPYFFLLNHLKKKILEKEKKTKAPEVEEQTTVTAEETAAEVQAQPDAPEAPPAPDEAEALRAQIAEQEDKFLRLCAEYDNFRRRSKLEKDGVYADATADAVKALLPVYDNLERAVGQAGDEENVHKKGAFVNSISAMLT